MYGHFWWTKKSTINFNAERLLSDKKAFQLNVNFLLTDKCTGYIVNKAKHAWRERKGLYCEH